MRFSPLGVAVLENRAECQLVQDVTEEFPGRGRPFGEHYLFLHALKEDIETANRLTEGVVAIDGLVGQARSQKVTRATGDSMRFDPSGGFKPCVISDEKFKDLRDATLLAAIQEAPSSSRDNLSRLGRDDQEALTKNIQSARLLGAVMLEAGLVVQTPGSAASRFVTHSLYSNSFHDSVSEGARSHLSTVRDEFTGAAVRHYGSFGAGLKAAVAAYARYGSENPHIIRLARIEQSAD